MDALSTYQAIIDWSRFLLAFTGITAGAMIFGCFLLYLILAELKKQTWYLQQQGQGQQQRPIYQAPPWP